MIPAVVIFSATYLVMAVGKLPGYRLDRAGAALLGACLMVVFGVLTIEEAFAAIDIRTITLLFGMMIVAANLRLSGFFSLVNEFVAAKARHPLLLLAMVVFVPGVLSAFLVNDTICLVMTPMVLEVVHRLGRRPLPYLLALAMASNAGSLATITGNPQNMIIGAVSRIPYADFSASLAPVALAALLLTVVLVAAFHPAEFLTRQGFAPVPARPVRWHRTLVLKSLGVLVAMIALFLAGFPVSGVAVLGGAVLLVTRRIKPQKVYFDIDWPLLVMFVGLFVVVAGLDRAVIGPQAPEIVARFSLDRIPILATVTAVLSNLVSNVPAVLVLRPFVESLPDPGHAWRVVAMAATLAGNFALVGSVANLIVAEKARAAGVRVGFWAHFRIGAPLTVLSIALGVLWLG